MTKLSFNPLVFFILIIGLIALLMVKSHLTPTNQSSVLPPPTNYQQPTESPGIFYGSNTDISNLLPSSPYYVKNSKGQDLIDIAHQLGVNLFRVTIVNNRIPKNAPTKDDWDYVLNKLSKNHIQVIILPEFSNKQEFASPTSEELSDNYLTLLKNFIDSKVIDYSNPVIFGFDIRNEPDLSANNLTKLKQAAQFVKSRYPKLPITIGSWKVATGKVDPKTSKALYRYEASDGAKLADIVDYYSLHIYGFDKPIKGPYPNPEKLTRDYLNKVKSYTNKPILIEEFGAGNGSDINDQETIGNPNLQANTYQAVFKTVEEMHSQGVLGALGWLFYPRTFSPDGWTIIDDSANHIYPAAYVLQKHALGESDLNLDLPLASGSANYIYKDNFNNKTVSLKVGDIFGLALNLPQNNKYLLFTDNTKVLSIQEPLIWDSRHQYQKAVIKTEASGSAEVLILPTQDCQNCSTLDRPVFKLEINVVK